MDYLNNKMCVFHRDLKASNIFLEQKDKLIARIGDFGFAINPVNNYYKNHLNFGTLNWMV